LGPNIFIKSRQKLTKQLYDFLGTRTDVMVMKIL
jgi:hypothetical protein